MTTYAATLLDKAKMSISPANYSALADRLGVSRQYVSRWKMGLEPIPEKHIAPLCRLAHVDEAEWWLLLQADTAKGNERNRVLRLAQRLGIAAAVALCAIGTANYLIPMDSAIASVPLMFVAAVLLLTKYSHNRIEPPCESHETPALS